MFKSFAFVVVTSLLPYLMVPALAARRYAVEELPFVGAGPYWAAGWFCLYLWREAAFNPIGKSVRYALIGYPI